MTQARKKREKLQPILRLRQIQLDQENALLQKLRLASEEAKAELLSAQKNYMSGVEKLNNERQSTDRKHLITLEIGVDLAKSQWYTKLKAFRKCEEDEKKQLSVVLESQKRKKMIEKLDERFSDQHALGLKIHEQKQSDEFSIQVNARKPRI